MVVNLYAMFITPLLPFLTHTVVDQQQTIIAQTAYHRFGDACARGDL